jgi:hypothetical protein
LRTQPFFWNFSAIDCKSEEAVVQLQLIYSVITWERELEYTEERRKNHRVEHYVNYLAAPSRVQKKTNLLKLTGRLLLYLR